MENLVFVKVAGASEKNFEDVNKLMDKYITKDFNETSYKSTELGKLKLATREIATYTNGEKIYQITALLNKETNLYNITIEELKENKEIKIYTKDGDSFYTKINGTDKEIINHYNDNNFLFSEDSKQVIKIEIIGFGKNTGVVGCLESIKEFVFNYNNKAGCYLY